MEQFSCWNTHATFDRFTWYHLPGCENTIFFVTISKVKLPLTPLLWRYLYVHCIFICFVEVSLLRIVQQEKPLNTHVWLSKVTILSYLLIRWNLLKYRVWYFFSLLSKPVLWNTILSIINAVPEPFLLHRFKLLADPISSILNEAPYLKIQTWFFFWGGGENS